MSDTFIYATSSILSECIKANQCDTIKAGRPFSFGVVLVLSFPHLRAHVQDAAMLRRLTPIPLPGSRAPTAPAAAPAVPHGAAICRRTTNRSGAALERRLRSPTAPRFGEIARPRRPREARQSR